MRDICLVPKEVIQRRIHRLKRKMKSCNHSRMQERYQTIYLYLQGYPKESIAQITGRALSTVYRYINLYVQSGLKGLRMNHSPGRPSLLTQEQCQQVYDMVAHHFPKDVGFPVEMNWTAPLLQQWIEKTFGITYSLRGVLYLLHSLGFNCTRPTYTLANANPQKQEAFKKTRWTETLAVIR